VSQRIDAIVEEITRDLARASSSQQAREEA